MAFWFRALRVHILMVHDIQIKTLILLLKDLFHVICNSYQFLHDPTTEYMHSDRSCPAVQLHWVSLLHHLWILLRHTAFHRLQLQLQQQQQQQQQQLVAWASRLTGHRGLLPLYMSAETDHIPFESRDPETEKAILTQSCWVCALHVFQFIKMNFSISICHACCSRQHRGVRRRDGVQQAEGQTSIKDCYSKIDFL